MRDVVCHVVTSLDFGGVESHMKLISGVLKHSKMHHMFIAIGNGGAVEEELRAIGADVICLCKKTKIPSLGAFIALGALYRREHPLIVHAHGAEANFHALLAAYLARVPVRIGEEIGIPSHSNIASKIFRFVYGTAHRVIGVSQSVTDWLVSSGEVPKNGKAIRVYNPVELPSMDEANVAPEDVFRIGFVGRLEAVKNSLSLLDAFAAFANCGVFCELWIIGDGSERNVLEKRILNMKLADKVRLFGYRSDPATLIRQCHVYVQPSLSEGFGLSLVEAMGCGVPVISSAVGGAPEIIDHGKTGWLLPRASPQLITDALKEAWGLGPGELKAMGVRARKSVEGRFEPIQYLQKLEELYKEVSSERGIYRR